MDEQQFMIGGLEDWDTLLAQLIYIMEQNNINVVLFRGDLGAGKTTAIKKLVKMLGSEDEVTSPSFSLINEYDGREGNKIYHMDLYRLKNMEEALDIGIEEYLYSRDPVFIEWPDIILPLLSQENFMEINIETMPDDRRSVIVSHSILPS